MCGVLGVGADLRKWNEQDFAEARKWISLYKDIRATIQQGVMYRLKSPLNSPLSSVQYVSKDKTESVLFAFVTYRLDPVLPLIVYPRGLDPDSLYSLDGFSETRSGAAWMSIGITLHLGNLGSTVLRLRREHV